MYCSPNDTAQQVENFFIQIDEQLDNAVNTRKDSIVLLAGDSNSDVGTPRHRRLMAVCSKYGGRSLVNEPTRGSAQLDFVIGVYDPLSFSINSVVIPRLGLNGKRLGLNVKLSLTEESLLTSAMTSWVDSHALITVS